MGFNDVTNKAEAAMKARAETVSLTDRGGALVHTGVGGDDITLPRIVCAAQQSDEEVLDTGNFVVQCQVLVYSDARNGTFLNPDALTAHRGRFGAVVDAFRQDDIADLLSAHLTAFYCLGCYDFMFAGTEREDDHWISGFEFKAVCCGSDL